MSLPRVVVDGSNIATEGRSTPSLRQLDEAVKAFKAERPNHEIIVVVDATFAHRIDDDERPEFEDAAAHNELVYPPAGAVGRGDAFLLAIADRTDAVVLSNDSFQEFHGEYDWLFDKGRLIGGMPVPGVGWVFVERNPVRGPKSREAVRQAKRTKARVGSKESSKPMPKPKAPPPGRGRKAAPEPDDDVRKAIDEATEEAVHPETAGGKKRRSRRRRSRTGEAASEKAAPASKASGGRSAKSGRAKAAAEVEDSGGADKPTLNEPLQFIEFIAEHKLGSTVEGTVDRFASHGAFVDVDGAQCYIPLPAMGDPPPRSAKEVLKKGETRTFVVQALDAPRRGIELAIPGFEEIAGQPTEETVEAEISESSKPRRSRRRRPRKEAKEAVPAAGSGEEPTESDKPAAAKKAAKKKAASKKTPAKKKAAAKKAPAKKKAAAKKAPAKKKAATKKAPAGKTAGAEKKSAAKKAPAKQEAAAKKTPAKKKAAAEKKAPAEKKSAAKKSTAKKAPAKKAAPEKKKAAAKKKASAKKAGPAKKTGAAKPPTKSSKKGAAKKSQR